MTILNGENNILLCSLPPCRQYAPAYEAMLKDFLTLSCDLGLRDINVKMVFEAKNEHWTELAKTIGIHSIGGCSEKACIYCVS